MNMSEISLDSDPIDFSCFFDGHLDSLLTIFKCWTGYATKIGYPDWTAEDEFYNQCSKFGWMEFGFI